MDRHTADEILACLCGERTVFPYYRDRYGIGLLRHLSRGTGPLSVASLKRSTFAPLLQKPRIRAALAGLGHAALDERFLAGLDYDPAQESYLLTLGAWGSERRRDFRWQQTSRPGINLVLQLNFNARHDAIYRRLGCPPSHFNYGRHPVSSRRNTLAWARIDLDWHSGCALIEEIQSDWVRRTAWLGERIERQRLAGRPASAPTRYLGLECPLETAAAYCEFVRERHAPVWAEAMLWASIAFVRDELGLRDIYYHSDESGALLKSIRHDRPPRSLYADLPRRFCFTRTEEPPVFLARECRSSRVMKGGKRPSFFRLETPGVPPVNA